ncbi:hypothetical protein E1281_18745 [Actinomadura sp. KC345]|uniref:hypothetical protein n=1 Tax=Actinomadura sp. KC345 TaxID=2530371 RepID=UPI001050F51B|nr:hypothetical protein [Actinomadura sp. KC345]TDC52710.1 hypothetical protein E1281_18745 [Actinomadura sp. KC345]
MTDPRAPVTVDVGSAQTRQIAVGGVVAGAIGIIAVVSALTGNVDGGTGTRVAAFVIGLVFTLIGVLPLLLWRVAFRPRRIHFNADGLSWDDPSGAPWTVRWSELGEVTLAYPAPDVRTPGVTSSVTLDLRPAEPGFREAHPEMEHLAAAAGAPRGGHRVPFGHARSVVGPIDRALRTFAPSVYRREGPEIPEPRDRPRAVKLSVGMLGCFWGSLMVVALVLDGATLMTLAMVVFWTSLFAWLLVRVWAGGAVAVGRTAGLSKAIGVLYLVTIALLGLIVAPAGEIRSLPVLLAFLPGLVSAAALLTIGRLLSREDVRTWCAGRSWGL